MANLRLVLGVDVQPGDEHTPKQGQAGLWSLLHRLGRSRWPALLRGDVAWGVEPVMSRSEQEGLAYGHQEGRFLSRLLRQLLLSAALRILRPAPTGGQIASDQHRRQRRQRHRSGPD